MPWQGSSAPELDNATTLADPQLLLQNSHAVMAAEVQVLTVFIKGIEQAQAMDCRGARERALEQIASGQIGDRVITAVNKARLGGGIATATSV